MEKFVRLGYAGVVYQNFYHIPRVGGTAFVVIGALELSIVIGFLVGYKKS